MSPIKNFPPLGWGLVWNTGDKKEKNCGHKKEKVWNIGDKKGKIVIYKYVRSGILLQSRKECLTYIFWSSEWMTICN